MRFQLYYEFLTGVGESDWSQLSDKQQKELLRAGRQRKVVTPPEVEQDEDKTFVMDERVAFQIRIISREELVALPVFEMY